MWGHRKQGKLAYLNNPNMLMSRELGLKLQRGFSDCLSKKIYTAMSPSQPDRTLSKYCTKLGGVFNLEFSLDGRVLTAACEEKSVVMIDAANQTPFKIMRGAHDGCVNCVRYLNPTTMATCSDDRTVRLWDIRNLDEPVRILYGHTNWVKNIEYLKNSNTLVTSGFDGVVFGWDLNTTIKNNVECETVYLLNGLMRTKISNDGSKMVICSSNGYMILVHDLNIKTLSDDIGFFKPNLYRSMQKSEINYPSAIMFSYLFSQERKRNRIELVDDFPNHPEIISALQLHPLGWCALSRSINAAENEEWTAVHDIQARSLSEYEDSYRLTEDVSLDIDLRDESIPNELLVGILLHEHLMSDILDDVPMTYRPVHPLISDEDSCVEESSSDDDDDDSDIDYSPNQQVDLSVDKHFAETHLTDQQPSHSQSTEPAIRNPPPPAQRLPVRIFNDPLPERSNDHLSQSISDVIDFSTVENAEDEAACLKYKNHIFFNLPRLTNYVKEANAGKGFIKEQCFSHDGRIICSPYENGVRLLGFNDNIQEISHCIIPDVPTRLFTVSELFGYHSDCVVSCKFNPLHHQLVSGCLSGEIVWYKPVF